MLNGDPLSRYCGNINLSFAYVEGESLLMGLKARLCLRHFNYFPLLNHFQATYCPLIMSPASSTLQDVAVSSGSACTSASLEPSYVLRALGVEEDMVGCHGARCLMFVGPHCEIPQAARCSNASGSQAHTSIRFGIGRFTTEAEVDRAVELTVQHVNKVWTRDAAGFGEGWQPRICEPYHGLGFFALQLREMSPLWEMVQVRLSG